MRIRFTTTRLVRVFYCLLLFALTSCAAPTNATYVQRSPRHTYAPWSTTDRHPTLETKDAPKATGRSFVDEAFKIYARFITKIDGARCEHHPTCSRYARDAIRKHGMVLGAFLTVDRLVRGSRSSRLRSLEIHTIENGKPSFEDPIENNDFFF